MSLRAQTVCSVNVVTVYTILCKLLSLWEHKQCVWTTKKKKKHILSNVGTNANISNVTTHLWKISKRSEKFQWWKILYQFCYWSCWMRTNYQIFLSLLFTLFKSMFCHQFVLKNFILKHDYEIKIKSKWVFLCTH